MCFKFGFAVLSTKLCQTKYVDKGTWAASFGIEILVNFNSFTANYLDNFQGIGKVVGSQYIVKN